MFTPKDLTGYMQTVTCKCGAMFAACVEPLCYTDKEWVKSLRKYAIKGMSIKIVKSGTTKFSSCTCNKKTSDPIDPNQLSLF